MKCFAAKPERGARKQEFSCKYSNLFLLKLLHNIYRLDSVFAQSCGSKNCFHSLSKKTHDFTGTTVTVNVYIKQNNSCSRL